MSSPVRVAIFAQPVTPTSPVVRLDATLTEKHSATVELTKHPVEEGASPTDHAREAPEKLVVEGIITNTPVGAAEQQARGIVAPTTNRGPYAEGPGSPRVSGYAQEKLALLYQMKSARKALLVTTPLRDYTDVVLVGLEVSRTAQVGDAVAFTATFEAVRFVANETVKLQRRTPTAVSNKQTGDTKQGHQAKTPADDTSMLRTLSDTTGLSGVLGLGR